MGDGLDAFRSSPIYKKTYTNAKRNTTLRKREKRQKLKSGSLGYFDLEGARRNAQQQHKLVTPKGGFLTSKALIQKLTTKDALEIERNDLIKRMYNQGLDHDRMVQELTYFNEATNKNILKNREQVAAKKREDANAFPAIGKFLNKITGGAAGTYAKRLGMDVKLAGKGLSAITPDVIENPVKHWAKGDGKEALAVGVDKLLRPLTGVATAVGESAKRNQKPDLSKNAHAGFDWNTLTHLRGKDFAKGFDADTFFSKKLNQHPYNFYQVMDYLAPNAGKTENALRGLAFDLVGDPLNYVGLGVARKSITKGAEVDAAKVLENSRSIHNEGAMVDRLLAAEHDSLKPRQDAATRYSRLVRKTAGKVRPFSIKNKAGKNVDLPVGTSKRDQYRFIGEMSKDIKPEHIQLANDLESQLTGIPKASSTVRKFVNSAKASDNAELKSAGEAFDHVLGEYPHLANKVDAIRFTDEATEGHVMRMSTREDGSIEIGINRQGLANELAHARYIRENATNRIPLAKRKLIPKYQTYSKLRSDKEVIESIMIHEFGHVVAERLRRQGKWGASVLRHEFPEVSEYAGKNWQEKFAEWFAARHYGETPPIEGLDNLVLQVLNPKIKAKISPSMFRALRDAGFKGLPKTPRELSKAIDEGKIHVFNSQSKEYTALTDAEKAELHKNGIDLKDIDSSHLAFYDKAREIGNGYGLVEARADRDIALRDLHKDPIFQEKLSPEKETELDKAYHFNADAEAAYKALEKSNTKIRTALAFKVLGNDSLAIPLPNLELQALARKFPKPAKALSEITLLGTYQRAFRSAENTFKKNPGLFDIRTEALTGTSRIFQLYADHYGRLLYKFKPAERKEILSEMRSIRASGQEFTDPLHKAIWESFEDLLPAFKNEIRNEYTERPLSLSAITHYLHDNFSISSHFKESGRIETVDDLLDAFGSGIGDKVLNYKSQIRDLNKDWKRKNELGEVKRGDKAQYQRSLKVLEDKVDELNKVAEKGSFTDPLETLWAGRLAVEQAKGWKSMVDAVGVGFGIRARVKGPKGNYYALTDADENLIKAGKIAEKAGWRPLDTDVKGLEGYIFPPELVPEIHKLMSLFDHSEMNKFLHLFDQATRSWKAAATIYNPGYYTRNMIGEVMAGWFGGVSNPAYYAKSARILNSLRHNQELEELLKSDTPFKTYLANGRRDMDAKIIRLKNGEQLSMNEVLLMFHEHGLTTNFANTEFHEVLGPRGASKLAVPFKKLHGGLRTAGEVGENFPRMAHFLHALEDAPKHFSMLDAASSAAREVRKYHFDYSDVTQFEKAVMMRLFPFYKWTRKAVPMIIEASFATPGKIAAYPKFMTALSNATGNEVQGYIPQYPDNIPDFVKQMLAYPVGIDQEGNETFLNINTPGFDASKALFDPRSAAELMLNPALKTPFEQLWGEKLNEQFDKDGMQGRERLSEVAGQVPLTKFIDDIARRSGDKDSALVEPGGHIDERALSWSTGLTFLENKKPFDNKFDPSAFIERALAFGQNSKNMQDAIAGNNALWPDIYKFMLENKESFKNQKHIDKWVTPEGVVDYGLKGYYNPKTTTYGKYTDPTGKINWALVNQAKANGTFKKREYPEPTDALSLIFKAMAEARKKNVG